MFVEMIDKRFEPESGSPVNGPIYLAKENNVTSEQTFLVAVQVSGSVPPGRSLQPASLDSDYRISTVSGITSVVLTFGPIVQRINFPFTLLPNFFPERTEAFLASSAPADTGELPDGTIVSVSTYLNPIDLSAQTFVIIEDDDREFTYACTSTESCFMFLVAVIIGFEETSTHMPTHTHTHTHTHTCLLYTSPSPRDATLSRMPSSA